MIGELLVLALAFVLSAPIEDRGPSEDLTQKRAELVTAFAQNGDPLLTEAADQMPHSGRSALRPDIGHCGFPADCLKTHITANRSEQA